jgi:mono/diheme cytochrome c family protein
VINIRPHIALLVLIASPAVLQRAAGQQPAAGAPDSQRGMLTTYCATCHNTKLKTGGIAFDAMDLKAAADDAQVWEKALRKLRGHLMPPPGAPQPPQKDVDAFVAWMENALDSNAKGPKAGHVPIERLNRTEYAASVKALVGVDVNAKDVLPQDIQIDGFDNVAVALSVSPSFLDQYITAARHIANAAVGGARVSKAKYSIAANQNSDEPLPLGLRGGVKFKHNFPADGLYRININDLSVGLYTGQMENETTLVIMIDGRIVFRKPIGGPADLAQAERRAADGRAAIMERFSKIPVQVQAGVRDVVLGFIDRSHVESDENVTNLNAFGGFRGCGYDPNAGRMALLCDGIEITGPFNPTGVSRTPSRDLIFVCDPKKTSEPACAKQITENLARRAFRRPVTADDVAGLMPFYEAGRKDGESFDQGIEQVVAAVLASPEFLYRSIRGPKGASQDGFALTDLELASRLSFFLWNTPPDGELLKLAAAGGLSKPGAMEAQVRRMMADPKASSLVTSFAVKWLNLDGLDSVKPDPAIFPGFNEQLRHDFLYEAEAFISSIFLEDRNVVDLLTADHTFLNERLARHYGISGVDGPQFRKVTLADNARWGILGKAAVQMRTSYGDRTSPVLRGAWVLDKLMGTPPNPPPPNTATDLSQAAGEAPKTVRARLEQHRNKVVCRQCHGVIDPTGLALENFDAIGQFRTVDRQAANASIDASTVLPSGVAINGPVELRAQLADRPVVFVRALTEKLMMYAVNRELEYYDMPQVRAIVRGAAKDNYKLTAIVLGIVNSDAFRRQGPADSKKAGEQLAAK